ncbi:2-oxoacid:acceptor oxidoreductase family protein [Desulfospira joergensenii]|uniref:2-oxoacid:acceptor oxidoreductase family protein n=1 Tax=Desulfospira joergensenii TaxID=53329 RepID=UPI0003B6E494|nr:2-oxoacid:acceptor oxidoreductase family protein [Desulfospira joergensenii]
MSNNQQIIISGLGGQGVLFITKLLAGAAMAGNYRVMTSETHGMAQRGGNVISYLKIGDFSGPLIRPGKADGLIALKEESFHHHSYFLKPRGVGVVNSPAMPEAPGFQVYSGDAESLALEAGSPQSVNVVMLGFFTAAMEKRTDIISMDCLAEVIQEKFRGKEKITTGILDLLESGYRLYKKGRS